MYIIYTIHCENYSFTILSLRGTIREIIESIKNVSIEYLTNVRGFTDIKQVINKKDMIADGYYLKASNRYPNRLSLYQRTSVDDGWIRSNMIVSIKKLMIFSYCDLPSISSVDSSRGITIPLSPSGRNMPLRTVPYINELITAIVKRKID